MSVLVKVLLTLGNLRHLLPLLTVPFITRLYRKWIDGHLTEAEKLPGIDGVRAWLGVGNVICAVLIPLCVQGALGPLPMAYQPVTLIPLIFGLLLAYPLLNMASHSAQPAPAVPTEDLSKEREKVLQLLEAGKINPVESAELLNALAHSAPPTPKLAAEINPQRKMVLIGATVLLVGFFLPWFSINRNAMVNEMTTQIQQSMNGLMPADAMPESIFPMARCKSTLAIFPTDWAGGFWRWGLPPPCCRFLPPRWKHPCRRKSFWRRWRWRDPFDLPVIGHASICQLWHPVGTGGLCAGGSRHVEGTSVGTVISSVTDNAEASDCSI